MDSFVIHCTTCQARLQVRNRAAVGQILGCPKCGSMVLVEGPDPREASGPPAKKRDSNIPQRSGVDADTVDATPSAIDFAAHDFRTAADIQEDATHGSPTPESVPLAASIGRSRWREPAEGLPPEPPTELTATDETASPETARDQPMPPRASDWISPARRQLHQGLLMAGAAVAGIFLAVMALGWLVQPSTNSQQSVAGVLQPAPSSAAGGPLTQEEVRQAEPARNAEPPEANPLAGANSAVSLLPGTENPPPSGDAGPSPQPNASGLVNPSAVPLEGPPGLIPRTDETPADIGDPLDLDPLGLANGSSPSAPDAEPQPDPEPPPDASATSPSAAPQRPPRPEIDVGARLETKLPAIEIRETSLVDFATLVDQLSGIPVTLDVDALGRLGLSAKAPVSVELRGATIAEVLGSALQPLGLDYMLTDYDVLITQTGGGSQIREDTLRVGSPEDGDQAELSSLGAWITDLVAPRSWTVHGGTGSLSVDDGGLFIRQSEAVHFEIREFYQRLLRARRQPAATGASTDEGAGHSDATGAASWAARWELARERLGVSVSLNFARKNRLPVILQRLSSETGIQIVVDWESLGAQGVETDTEASFVAVEQPLPEALDTLLAPLKLGYRVIDAETLQVSTQQRLAELIEIEFYRLPTSYDDAAATALIDRIRAAVGPARFQEMGGQGAIRFDSRSHCLLVALPQADQRTVSRTLSE